MGIQLKNNAYSTLASSITASNTGIVVATNEGSRFPTLGATDYFYATLESTGGTTEIVKVTARSGDTMTIVRAQEGTSAQSFLAGSRIELRVTVGNVEGGTYTPDGASAVARTLQTKLREFVTPEDFGAVGDGVTDDTAAVQLAVNYCMTDPVCPKTLLVAGKYLLTSTVNINATGLSVIAARENYFRILGIGDGSGFYANSGITMFSSSDYTGVQSVVAMVQWENVAFVGGSATLYAARVISGAFIQVLFNSCVFYRVACMQTNNVNTFSYWFNNCHIKAWPSTFYELIYTSANDIIFDGCYFNGTGGTAFPAIRLSLVQGFKCTNNTFESMNGTPIVLRGSRACEISGNYFEGCGLIGSTYYIDLNEAGTSELAGVSISGNLFFMDGAQDADPAFFAINWDAIAAGSSNGNWCTGRLHKITNAQPGYDLSINGDTQSTTGSSAGRLPIRSDRYFNNCEANVLQAVPRANPPSPAYAGQIYYDSDDNKLKCYNGTSWNDLF